MERPDDPTDFLTGRVGITDSRKHAERADAVSFRSICAIDATL